jgi:hypothetical protein
VSEDRRRRWTLILLLLFVIVLAVWAARSETIKREQTRKIRNAQEQLALKNDHIVAQTASIAGLEEALGASTAEVERLRETIPESEVKIVTRWRTKTERVEIPVPEPVEVPVVEWRDRDCPVPQAPRTLPVDLTAEGTTAALDTREGAWFVVGDVTVSLDAGAGVVRKTLPWDAEATEALQAFTPPEERGRSWFVGVGPGWVDGELGLGASLVGPGWEPRLWRWSLGRWRPWATAVGATVTTASWVEKTGYQSSVRSESKTLACAAVGLGLEW